MNKERTIVVTLFLAFKYLRHPYNVTLDIQKHKEMPVISSVVDMASGITLFTEDGKIVHQISYTVRNTWKQFMELSLPKGSELWGAFVAGEPVKPSKNSKGKFLIPLNRSQNMDEEGLEPFDVEIIYFEKQAKFGWFGKKVSSFPVPDMVISRTIWSVYLPFDYSFIHFGGTMEKEEIVKGLRPILGLSKRVVDYDGLSRQSMSNIRGRGAGHLGDEKPDSVKRDAGAVVQREEKAYNILNQNKKLKSNFGKNMAMDDRFVAKQLDKEISFSQRLNEVQIAQGGGGSMTTGSLPIKVKVPTTGQVYRFAKQIVSNEELSASVTFVYDTPFLIIKIIILLLILFILYKQRSRVSKQCDDFKKWYSDNLKKHLSPLSITIALAILFLFSMFFLSSFITRLIFFFFLIAFVYFVYTKIKGKKDKKE